jgi:hypothetical protein
VLARRDRCARDQSTLKKMARNLAERAIDDA